MLSKYYIPIAAFLGALTVALGAFGAHALKAVLSPAALIPMKQPCVIKCIM